MKCTEAELLIIDLLENSRMTSPSTDLSTHLSSCASCKALFTGLSEDFLSISAGRRTEPDPALYDRVISKMDSTRNESLSIWKPAGRIIRLTPAVAMAAAAVIAGIWLGGRLMNVYPPTNPDVVLSESAERSGMLQAYAEDVYLYDSYDARLESYLTENETEIRP